MSTTPRYAFAVVVMLAWLHLIFAVYPTPAQKAGEISKLAEDAIATDQSLRSQGVSEKLLPRTTKEEYVTALFAEYWRDWSLGTVFLVLGVLASVTAFRGGKLWPWVVGLTSAAYAAVITYPIFTHSIGAERSFSWVTPIARGVLSGQVLPAYHLLVQPLLHLAIVITCALVWRHRNSGFSRAKVA